MFSHLFVIRKIFLHTCQENLRLVRMQDRFVRPTDSNYGTGFSTGFADGFPILLTAEESLEEMNSRMVKEEAVGMERFRPK